MREKQGIGKLSRYSTKNHLINNLVDETFETLPNQTINNQSTIYASAAKAMRGLNEPIEIDWVWLEKECYISDTILRIREKNTLL